MRPRVTNKEDLHPSQAALASGELRDAERSNLVHQLTSFVGRHSELSTLTKTVRESRLITLVGAGGVGKTRLALELAKSSVEQWADGVWWVDLTAVDEPEQLSEAVVSVLSLHGLGDATDRVISWLKDRSALLILDNCEHLVAACAELCQASLEQCPRLTIMVTSREPLGIPGEARFSVSPLSESDALSLFEQRGRLVRRSFAITPLNRDVVAHMCRRLDQLPLAIELVAATLGLLTEQEISDQLADRFRVLSSSRSGDARHRTLTATIDWSYRLLTEDERALLRRLSVFRGGFTLVSAQAVCATPEVPDVLGSLRGLVEKSMVVAERLDENDSRYRLLESQGAYAESKLQDAGETDSVRLRHYEFFKTELLARSLPLVGPRSNNVVGPAEEKWKRREMENFWAALHWARHNAEDLGLGMLVSVVYSYSGDVDRKRAWLADLLEDSPEQGSMRSWALGMASHLAWEQHDWQTALRLCELRYERVLASGDTIQQAITRSIEGNIRQDMGQLDLAEAAQLKAVELLEGSDNSRVVATVKNNLGCLALSQERFGYAREVLTDAVNLVRSTNDRLLTASLIESLANAELGCGDIGAAVAAWRESIGINRESLDVSGVIGCIGGLARAAAKSDDYIRAVRLAGAHKRLSDEYAYLDQLFWADQLDRTMQQCRAKLGDKYDKAWQEGLNLNVDRAVEYALEEQPMTPSSPGPLSRREAEVARLVAKGMTNRAIAKHLFLSERTVEGHVDRIRTKLGFGSRTELAAWVVARGLID